MRKTVVLIMAGMTVALAPSSAVSDEPASGRSKDSQSFQGFANSNPDCMDFTDQCTVCSQQSGALVCSTPKIACIKRELQCTKIKAESVEK